LNKLFVICDEETLYAERLADYLSHRKEFSYEIRIFSSCEILFQNMKGKQIDLLLIEEKEFLRLNEMEHKKHMSIKKTILLSDIKGQDAFVAEESIYKYQPASNILSKLLTECLDYGLDGYGDSIEEESELIGVYSPVKRVLKTTFSYTLAQILSENESVLYLNFEGCSGISTLLPIDAGTNLADMLFDYSIYREEYPKRFHEFIQDSDGIGIIPPVETVSELQCVPAENFISMLRRIKRNGIYKKVVLDVGDNVNGIIDILRICDLIYMPCRDDYISKAKMTSFDKAIDKYDKSDDLNEKIKKLELPHFDDLGEDFSNIKYGQLGGYVRDLVQGNKAGY